MFSPWMDDAPEAGEPLRGEIAADVCVIGAGYTGLSAALALRREGLDVVVVEPTGADTQIYCKVAGKEVTAVVRERHPFRPGEIVHFTPQLTFLFDPASGARLA